MFGKRTNHPAGRGLKDTLVWLTLLPVLLSMWMIFGFSAQPAEQSSQTSSRVVDTVIRLFVPDFEELDAARREAVTHQLTVIVRKTAHAAEYAVLGFFLQLHVMVWRRHRRRMAQAGSASGAPGTAWHARIPGWAWSLLIGCLYAVTDEIHQGFVADRGPRVTDVMVDAAGVIAGVAVCGLMWTLIRRYRHRRMGKNTA